jgi:hypothetical protein
MMKQMGFAGHHEILEMKCAGKVSESLFMQDLARLSFQLENRTPGIPVP